MKPQPVEVQTGRCQGCDAKVEVSLTYGPVGTVWDIVGISVKPHACAPLQPTERCGLCGSEDHDCSATYGDGRGAVGCVEHLVPRAVKAEQELHREKERRLVDNDAAHDQIQRLKADNEEAERLLDDIQKKMQVVSDPEMESVLSKARAHLSKRGVDPNAD